MTLEWQYHYRISKLPFFYYSVWLHGYVLAVNAWFTNISFKKSVTKCFTKKYAKCLNKQETLKQNNEGENNIFNLVKVTTGEVSMILCS